MTRRIKRTKEFDVTLSINDDTFIRPPRESQRNWLLNRAMKEFSDELVHLNEQSKHYVPGRDSSHSDRTQLALADQEIMEDWQIPIMKAMAELACVSHGDILEIGFGRGVGSDFIQEQVVASHTVIECNDSIVKRFDEWKIKHSGNDIRLLHGMWQDVIGNAGQFDGIFFHTYPLSEADFVEQVAQSATFAEHFFDTALAHLKTDGVFTYLTNEVDSLSRPHQRALLKRFRSFSMSKVRNLNVPSDTQDAMWADSMVVVQVVK